MPMENQDSQNKRGKIVTFVDCGNVFIHNHNYLSYYNTAFLTNDKNKLIQVPPPPPLVIRIRFDNVMYDVHVCIKIIVTCINTVTM